MTIRISRTTTVLLWVAQVVAAALFLMTGASKLRGAESMVALFDTDRDRTVVPVSHRAIEVVSAVLLLVPSLEFKARQCAGTDDGGRSPAMPARAGQDESLTAPIGVIFQ